MIAINDQSSFQPSPLLRNPHLQTILASTGPRKRLVRKQAQHLLSCASSHLIDCSDGVRLQAELSFDASNHKGTVFMIHGWEGCVDSLYLLSLGATLFHNGYNVFRLNLRDHGPTHHLNPELYNSTRVQEVLDAVRYAHELYPASKLFMAGFSLGGNFCLRVAAQAKQQALALEQVVAVCPVLNPLHTMQHLQDGWFVYHRHFVNGWQQSLKRKLEYYPELGYGDIMPRLRTLQAMNDYFVPHHTGYADTASYLLGYALTGATLQDLEVPCQLITSYDDPMIHPDDLDDLASSRQLTIELTRYGGHCGYLNNLKLESWIDGRILDIFDARHNSTSDNSEKG
jgi:hypothetical protein